ncbi:strigolactones hydrolase CXE15 [Apium graveolens]|uniref:strigolactones hydrolase CXE15 n=1 Tax=Apium graveolens TaxID=4045 RepID=UPI003D78B3F0
MGSLPRVVEDCHGFIQVYSDGFIFRLDDSLINLNIAVQDDGSVIWQDSVFDKTHGLSLRLYKPVSATATSKLPIVYYLHGGGFCLGSRTWNNCHNGCLRLSAALQAVVVAPDYRLAPEYRLPAAIDDSVTGLEWLRDQAQCKSLDKSFLDCADFNRVFVLGDSSGGNMAHHLAVQFGPGSIELSPVRVRGYVLLAPFFGGTERTKSEAEGEPEPVLTLETLDRFWRLSLPAGKKADHPFANPFGPASPNLETVKLDPILVMAGGKELMKDRIKDYAMRLKGLGKNVDYVEFAGKQHGFFTNDPYSDVSNQFLQLITKFMHDN